MVLHFALKTLQLKCYAFAALFILYPHFAMPLNKCQDHNNVQQIILNPEAQVYFGVLVGLSSPKSDEACGKLSRFGILQYEALRWGLERINKNFGQVGSRIVHDSFIPGIQIGLRLYDTCGLSKLSVEGLGSLHPDTGISTGSCPLEGTPALASKPLGILDLTQELKATSRFRSLVEEYNIPFVNTDFRIFDSGEERVKAILSSTSKMEWRKIFLIVEGDKEQSVNLAEELERRVHEYNSYVFQKIKIGKESTLDDVIKNSDVMDSDVIVLFAIDSTLIREVLKSFSDTNFPVLLLARTLTENFWQFLKEENLEKKSNENFWKNKIFQISFSPSELPEFDHRWNGYYANTFFKNKETDIITSYLAQLKNCTLKPEIETEIEPCTSFQLNPEDQLLGTASSGPIYATLHGLFTLVGAYKNAWKEKCKYKRGLCFHLAKLSDVEFISSFLNQLELNHTYPGNRSPGELRGGMTKGDTLGSIKGMNYGLFKINFEGKKGITATEVIQINDMNPTIKSAEIFNLFKNRKMEMISPSAADDPVVNAYKLSLKESEERIMPKTLITENEPKILPPKFEDQNVQKNEIFIPSENKIYVAGLFPLHKPSEDQTDCSDEIDKLAAQEVEAFLWTVDQINLHTKLLPKTHLGVVILDTCGSKIRATNQITNLIQNSSPGINVSISEILAFVTSLDPETARVAGDLLSSLNITSINLGSAGAHSPFSLKMKPPINKEAEALVQILNNYGWNFVSLLVSKDNYESQLGANEFKAISKMSGICIAEEIRLFWKMESKDFHSQILKLIKRSKDGANIIVTFLSKEDKIKLKEALKRTTEEGEYTKGQLSFLGGTNWGDNKGMLSGGEIGGLFLQDGQQDVDSFTLHYNLLTPRKAKRNPWFQRVWEKHNDCNETSCLDGAYSSAPPFGTYHSDPSTPRVIQALFSFGAALTQLLDNLCPHANGNMCPRLLRYRQRLALNEYMRNTEVSRVDRPTDFFQFSDNFHGNTPLEIFNVRGSSREGSKIVSVEKVGKYENSELELTKALKMTRNGFEVSYESFPSSCLQDCHTCSVQDSNYVFVESQDKVYIMGIFDVHSKGPNPLECGPLVEKQGIENIESLLWTIQEVNRNSSVKFGAIIFDSCFSKERVVNEVGNFFKGKRSSLLKEKIPTPKHITGIISGTKGEVIRQLLDITQPYNITVFTTQARQAFLEDSAKYPHVFKLVPSTSMIAKTLVSLIQFWDWELVSVVYSNYGDNKDVFKEFSRRSETQSKYEIAASVGVSQEGSTIESMLNIWTQLVVRAQEGSRAVIVLLDSINELLFLQTASRLLDEGIFNLGDFVYILTKSPRPFFRKEYHALGSLIVQPVVEYYEQFGWYFKNLSLSNHTTPYNWFKEYWTQINSCKGATCSFDDLERTDSLKHSAGVVETSNAVWLIRNTWENMKKSLCEDSLENGCVGTIVANTKLNFYNTARTLEFKRMDGRAIKFNPDGTDSQAKLQVLNFQKSAKDGFAFVQIGSYLEKSGLSINKNLAVGYQANETEVPFSEIQSKCIIGSDKCGMNIKGETALLIDTTNSYEDQISRYPAKRNSYVEFQQMFATEPFGISLLIPLHEQGGDFFSCGTIYSESIFQNFVAAAYALTKINQNDDIGIGAIVFDFCNRVEKAREQYFRYFSGKMQKNYDIVMTKERIVAAISFDDKAAEAVSSILSSNYIPHFSSPVLNRKIDNIKDTAILSSVPTRSAEIHLYLKILKTFKWKYVSVIYDNNMTGNKMNEMFRAFARQDDICVSDSLPVPERLSKEYVRGLVDTLSSSWKPKVIILLIDDADNIRTLLEIFDENNLSENFVFLAGSAWGNKLAVTENLERISSGALTFTLETYDLPEFRHFLSNLTLDNHGPIPRIWFEDYFQHRYECKLSGSINPREQFSKECLRSEKTHPDEIIQDPFVYHTILSINSVARGINSYINKHCKDAKTVRDCNFIQSKLLLEIMEQGELYLNSSKELNSFGKGNSYGYHLWNFRKLGNSYGYVNIGTFKNSVIELEKSIIEFKIGPFAPESYCNEGICLDICSYQSPVYAIMKLPNPLPIDYNFRTIYGIVTSCVSLIGIITVLIFLIYFMMAYPKVRGSSILGYFILIGCIMIYSVNFAFIFQPTIGTCSIRRFLMGVGYAIVYSSMLVLIVHSWRSANYLEVERNNNRNVIMILVCIVLIMIEVILASAWLILYPPQVDLVGEMWRCSPSETFEKELVISLVYDMILIGSTLLICCEAWRCRETAKKTRWILLSALSTTFTWILWTIIATQAPLLFRDPAIVIGNIVAATAVLLFLYSRRFYIYSHLSDDLKGLEMKSTFSSRLYNSTLYNNSHLGIFSKNTINPIRDTPGTQFVGDQEVSFRTVALPPDRPQIHRSFNRDSRRSKCSQGSLPTLQSSIEEEDPQEDINFNSVFESSEEDFAVDAVQKNEDSELSANSEPTFEDEKDSGLTTEVLTMKKHSIRRGGSNQMLVFLADGSSAGEISRI